MPWVTLIVSARGGGGHRQRDACLSAGLRAHLVRDEPRRSAPGLVRASASALPHALSPDADRRRADALVAAFYPIKQVAELVNIGTLSAFIIICFSVIVLRRTRPDVPRTFRTPLVPWIPLAGIGFSVWLLSKLPAVAWDRFAIWMALGLLVYFLYGRRHSLLANKASTPPDR